MKKISNFLLVAIMGLCAIPCYAQDFIAIAKDGNVYDEANTKYITLNQDNQDVSVIPGMVFKTTDHPAGWYKIEYSPGLHAFIPEQIVAGNFITPKPGKYRVANLSAQTMEVQSTPDGWTCSVAGKSYKGSQFGDIIVFFDKENNIAFSLVDLGNGPIPITYDNVVTNFF